MGIFDKISRGISRGIGNAISNATQKAVEKKATEVIAPKINQAADKIVGAQQNANTNNTQVNTSALEGALGNFANAVNGYATKTAQNLKVCPKCNAPASADKKFCPECGGPLPEKTLAAGAVCTNCGKQNGLNEKFCSDCGTKLPIALEAEQKQRDSDQGVMAEWEQKLSAYPKWSQGGDKYNIESHDQDCYSFCATFSNYDQANNAVEQYREYLLQNGFKTAGQYPTKEHLYKKIDGVCYHVDTEHCFEGDSESPRIYFDRREPLGGFDYVKPEPKKKGFFSLFK